MASVLYFALLLSLSCVLWNGADAQCRLTTTTRPPIPTTRPPATTRPPIPTTRPPATTRPTTRVLPHTRILLPTPANCPSGWSKYGDRCFYFYNAQTNWATAERLCTGLGANLASIRSSAEHIFLKNLVNSKRGSYQRTWVGGNDAVKEGVWLWSDGSRFTYTQWGRGEPNNYGGRENCMEINLKGSVMYLNDIVCTRNNFFICAKKA